MSQPSTTPHPDWRAEIDRLETENVDAFLARDLATLRRLWSPAFLVNSPLERINDSEQVLGLLERGIIAHSSYEHHVERVERHGDVVITMGRDAVINPPDPATTVHRRWTHVWQRQGEGWTLIARHAQRIAAGEPRR